MPGWLFKAIRRIRDLAADGSVRLTAKADDERVGLGFDTEDVREVVASLTVGDSAGRSISHATGEWMYIFKPRVGNETLYVKLILRGNCVILSFHDDEGETDETGE